MFDWLNKVYELDAAGRIEAAIDVLFDEVDDMMGIDWEGVDRFCREVDVNRFGTELCVGVAVITRPMVEHTEFVPSRGEMMARLRDRVEELKPGKVEALLGGLMDPMKPMF